MSIRVVIADDHPVVRDGLRLTIERSGTDITVIGEASDGMEVLTMARTRPADVFILEITMPNLNGPQQQGNRRPAGPVGQHHPRPPEQRDGQVEHP